MMPDARRNFRELCTIEKCVDHEVRQESRHQCRNHGVRRQDSERVAPGNPKPQTSDLKVKRDVLVTTQGEVRKVYLH
jgi:hypothetical protein